jgi:hypothetical protein
LTKTPLTITDKVFDLKFCLVGNSGSGKTHFCGTYSGGPIHFYMCDPGGEKTLHRFKEKIDKGMITIDRFSLRHDTYTDVWKQLQKDAKAGFFEEMREKKGLVVIPDSLTTLAMMALTNVAKNHNRDLKNVDKAMRIQDWGVLGTWLKELIAVINDIPCAVAATAHLHIDTDKDGAVIARVPALPGNIRYSVGLFFDEVYLLESRGSDHMIKFKESNHFQAKSRTFDEKSAKNITMDDVAAAYLKGTPLPKK